MVTEAEQIVAIINMDIDLLMAVADRKKDDSDMLYGSIRLLKQKKDALINDPDMREMRYEAFAQILTIAKSSK